MLVRRTSPLRDLDMLVRRMDGLFHNGVGEAETMDHWAPAMDVIEKGDQVVLRAELPGLSEDEVEITVENGTLTLQGEKKFQHEESEGNYRRLESRYGSFHRTFSLPTSVDQERIDAHFSKGVLGIELPKAEQAKPKKISVRVQ